MEKNLHVVLMAGGVGTRFWPYSRNGKPKQFLDVLGTGKTLLQSTYERYLPVCLPENIWIVTHEEHASIVMEQLAISKDQILTEPMRKNTAPCIAYAANKIFLKDPDAVMVVSPSDHLILSEKEFLQTIQKAVDQAKSQDKLITLGIKPTRPETGYGYIQFLEGKSSLKKVKTFTEKPAIALAKTFLESGDFVWNSGVFVWGVNAILKAFQRYLPEMSEAFEEIRPQLFTPDEKAVVMQVYAQTKNISIDYGVMEKADNVYVSLGNFSWSDLGSWTSLHDASVRDDHNNVVQGETLVYDTRNSVIKGPNDKLIVVQGLNGYLVGVFDNVVIVCEKDKEELFRRYVNDLKAKSNGSEYL
jgi:mannose-1-phosphate guanylyltransferase